MAEREELILEVEVDKREAQSALEDVERSAKDTEEAVEELGLSAQDAGRLLVAMAQDVDTELRADKEAADALARALGPELTAKADLDAVIGKFKEMGLTTDQIVTDVDELALAIKEVDQINTKNVEDGLGGIGNAAKTAGEQTDGLRDRATNAHGVLANMIGNTAQDVSGLSSSLGVAIGQMGEYSADALLAGANSKQAFKEMALVGAPIAALAGLQIAIQGVQGAIADWQAEQQAFVQQQLAFNEAVRDSGSQFEAINQLIEDNTLLSGAPEMSGFQQLLNDIPILGRMLDDTADSADTVATAMAAAGISQEEWFNAMRVDLPGGLERYNEMNDRLLALKDTGAITADQFDLLSEQFARQGQIVATNAVQTAAAVQTTRTSLEAMNQALRDQTQMTSQLEVSWRNLIEDLRDGNVDTNSGVFAWRELQDALGLSNEAMAELAQQKLDEQLRADAQAAEDLGETITDTAGKLSDAASEIDDIRSKLGELGPALRDALDVGDADVDLQVAEANIRSGLDQLFTDIQDFIDEHGAVDWSVVLDPTQSAQGFDANLAGMIVDIRDTFQDGIVNAFESGGAPAAQAFVTAFLPQLLALGMTPAQAYELLGLPADGSVEAIIEPIVEQQAVDRARAILDAIAGAGFSDPRIAAIQIALERGTIEGDIAEVAALILAQELGIPISLEGIPPEDIAAAQVYLDNNPLTVTLTSETKGVKETFDSFRKEQQAAPVVIDADADMLPATRKVDDFTGRKRTAEIGAEALTETASVALDGLKSDKAKGGSRIAPITAQAIVTLAELLLNAVARPRTAVINVATGTIDVPTAREIADRIGVVRVPIDAYIRNVPRIDGTRYTV